MRQVLRPLSLLFDVITSSRNYLFEKGWLSIYRSALPVVSIGNISAGGTGKTPLVAETAELLRKAGHAPVILSRGYKGTLRGPVLLSPETTSVEAGDEPVMLARKLHLPVVVAKNRAAGAKYIEAQKLGTVIILDDGFQHRFLARDIDIVTIDVSSKKSAEYFINGRLLPEGILREDRSRALRRASAVVLSLRGAKRDAELISKISKEIPAGIPIFESTIELHAVEPLKGGDPLSIREVFIFSGIANPEGFSELLCRAGFAVRGSRFFKDHHSFSEAEIAALVRESRGLPLICTEKDAVKLEGIATQAIYVAKITGQTSPEKEFYKLLSQHRSI